MSKTSVFKNLKSAIGLVIFFVIFCGGSIYHMFDDYGRMQVATSGYDYCSALCNFTENAGYAFLAMVAGLVCQKEVFPVDHPSVLPLGRVYPHLFLYRRIRIQLCRQPR